MKLEEVKTQTMEEDEEVLFKMCAPGLFPLLFPSLVPDGALI